MEHGLEEGSPSSRPLDCHSCHSPIVRNFVDTPVRERLERLRERVALGEFGKRAQREVQAERERSEVEAEAVREQAAGLIGEAAGKILSQNHGQRYYD